MMRAARQAITITLLAAHAALASPAGAQPGAAQPKAAQPGAAQPSKAQPSTAQSSTPLAKPHLEAMTKKARELYAEGVAAFERKRWADARAALLAAWALHPHWTIAGNLGAAELRLGLFRDAAERLALYVREIEKDKDATAKEREEAAKMYAEARAKVGTVMVRASVEGAEVYVDETRIGKAPLVDPVFVEPGGHTLEARAAGYWTAHETVAAGPGAEQEVVLELKAIKEEADAPAPALPKGPVAQKPEQEPLLLRARTPAIVAGSVAAGGALIAGVVLTAMANGKASDAEALRGALVQEHGTAACSGPAPAPGCAGLNETIDRRDALSDAAFWSFIGAGVLGAGTVVFALVTRTPAQYASAGVMPAIGPRGGGVMIRAGF